MANRIVERLRKKKKRQSENRQSGQSEQKPKKKNHLKNRIRPIMNIGKLWSAIQTAMKTANEVTSGKKSVTGIVIIIIAVALDWFFGITLDPEVYAESVKKIMAIVEAVGAMIATIGVVHKDVKENELKKKVQIAENNSNTLAEAESVLNSLMEQKERDQ